jgi:hypothetical protein
MYNIDRKQRFIVENYPNEGTQANIKRVFDKTEVLEEQYSADLDRFNRNQIIEVLGILDSATVESLNKDFTIIKKYKKWSAAEGYSVFDSSSISLYRQDMQKYVNKHANVNQYISNRKEFYELLRQVYNPQEKVIPVLLYEGVSGKNFEEIKNLKSADCLLAPGTIRVTRDDGTIRLLNDIDKRSMDVIMDAINQTEYHRSNGEAKGKTAILQLNETPYVLRTIFRKDAESEKISTVTLDTRIRLVKKWTGLYWINAKNIFFSGMFDRLQSMEANGVELTKDEYIDVCLRFNWGINDSIDTDDIRKKVIQWNVLKDRYELFKKNLQD